MTGDPSVDGATDDEAHLAALLAVLARARADEPPRGTPLQQWRARRLAALRASSPAPGRPATPH